MSSIGPRTGPCSATEWAQIESLRNAFGLGPDTWPNITGDPEAWKDHLPLHAVRTWDAAIRRRRESTYERDRQARARS